MLGDKRDLLKYFPQINLFIIIFLDQVAKMVLTLTSWVACGYDSYERDLNLEEVWRLVTDVIENRY